MNAKPAVLILLILSLTLNGCSPTGETEQAPKKSLDPDTSDSTARSDTEVPASGDQICNEWGCVEVLNLLSGQQDGKVGEDGDISFNRVQWDATSLPNPTTQIVSDDLFGLEKVAAQSAKSVVRLYGDVCMDQSGAGIFLEPVFEASLMHSGFFISNSQILTTAAATRDLEFLRNKGYGNWGGIMLPPNETCASFGAMMGPDVDLQQGLGPMIQLFDGGWATGKFVWVDDTKPNPERARAVIELTAYTYDRSLPFSQWIPWDSNQSEFPALPVVKASTDSIGQTLTIHSPDRAHGGSGGWQLSNADGRFCSANASQNETGELFLTHYSDAGSFGAPVLNESGRVIATIGGLIGGDYDSPVCPENIASTSRNTLGVLSEFYADGSALATGFTFMDGDLDNLYALGVDSDLPTPTMTQPLEWPNFTDGELARFEIPLFDADFTSSGFPKAELQSPAIEHVKQATIGFIRVEDCIVCDENIENTNFSVPCYCTGFAISDSLIVTNDHCVPTLGIGETTAVKTYSGGEYTVTLIGKSSIDGETEYNSKYEEIYGAVQQFEGMPPQTGTLRGDVALLRTKIPMNLEPLEFADSSELEQFEPLITVGHPAYMTRTGPWVTAVGSFSAANYFTRTEQYYQLPADSGSSGGAVVNLQGKLVGQIAIGGAASQLEAQSLIHEKYQMRAIELVFDKLGSSPAPFEVRPRVPITLPMSGGASSNYIRELVEKWAPGELGG